MKAVIIKSEITKENEKSVLDWFNELPEPIRSNATHNYNGLVKSTETLAEAIMYGFIWGHTMSGQSYWENVYNTIVETELN